jgi:hypothetical protein
MFDVDILVLLINNDDHFFSLQIYTLHNVVHSQGIWGIIVIFRYGSISIIEPYNWQGPQRRDSYVLITSQESDGA